MVIGWLSGNIVELLGKLQVFPTLSFSEALCWFSWAGLPISLPPQSGMGLGGSMCY